MTPTTKNPLLNRTSYLDDDSFVREEKQLQSEILEYKVAYCSIAVYSTIDQLLAIPYYIAIKDIYDTKSGLFVLFTAFCIPCVLKPLFGWLGDWYFPFRYRLKSYCVLTCLINLILVSALHQYNSVMSLGIISTLMKLNLLFIESISQGMTTITIQMEHRLMVKKHPFAPEVRNRSKSEPGITIDTMAFGLLGYDRIWQPSYTRIFGQYWIVYIGARYFWLFIGHIAYSRLIHTPVWLQSGSRDILENSSYRYSNAIIAIASIILIIGMMFFKEKKMTTCFSENNKNKHLLKSLSAVFFKPESTLIYITVFMLCNPLLYVGLISYTYLAIQARQREMWKYIDMVSILAAGVICMAFLSVTSIFLKRVKSIHFMLLIIGTSLAFNIVMVLFSFSSDFEFLDQFWITFGLCVAALSGFWLVAGFSTIFIVDRFIKKVPIGHEFFCLNLLTATVYLGTLIGNIMHILLVTSKVGEKICPKNIKPLCYGSIVFLVIPGCIYWGFYRSEKQQADKPQVKDGKLQQDAEWTIVDDIRERPMKTCESSFTNDR